MKSLTTTLRTLTAGIIFGSSVGLFFAQAVRASSDWSKPISQFTMEDVFSIRDQRSLDKEREAAKAWEEDAREIARAADDRNKSATGAIVIQKLEIETLKARKKQAEKSKNDVEKTLAKRSLQEEETALKLLERVVKLSDLEGKLAKARLDWSEAVIRAVDAGHRVGKYRESQVARAAKGEEGSTGGLNMDPKAYDAYKEYTKAQLEVAKATKKVSETLEMLSKEQERLMKDMVKGGMATKS